MQAGFEQLGPVRLYVTPEHKFGGDAFFLSDFASPRRRDRVCDLCSGCGIVPALWFRQPETTPKEVWAVELQEQAVAQIARTLREGGLPAGVFHVIHADLRDLHGKLETGSFDLVTCNPPYTATGSGIMSENMADQIARHETSCSLADVCAAAKQLLRYGGRLCLCQRPDRLTDAICALRTAGLEPKRLRMVQQRPECAPWLVLLEGRFGGKAGIKLEPPLIIEGSGGFSPELLRIYGKERNL